MLLPKTLLTYLLSFTFLVVYAQPELTEKSESIPTDPYDGIVENFHLHLNKTAFVRGERIWFKAYVYDQNSQKPSLETSNLHVGLFDLEGREVKRKLLYVNNGVSYGDFAIDSTLTDKQYYISAWTNWMKNFEHSNSFNEKIEIINTSDAQVKDLFPSTEYEIQVHPEGGSVLAGVDNVMAIHWKGYKELIDQTKVRLLSSNGDTIIDPVRLSGNGVGKFTYRHRGNRNYELHFNITGSQTIVKKLPPPKPRGVSLLVNSLHPTNVHIQVLTNERSYPGLSGKNLRLMIKGQDSTQIQDIIVSGYKQGVIVEKQILSKGINHLRLENEQGELLASRNFFNYHFTAEDLLSIDSRPTIAGDSIEISIRLKQPLQEQFSLSVSTLPSETKAYKPYNSLKTSFAVRPYLNNADSDLRFNFEGSSRSKYYEWDALLLNQDVSRSTEVMFRNAKISDQNQWESGISIDGWAKNADLEREKYVWMYSGSIENTLVGYLEKDKTFRTEAVLYKNDSLAFTLIDHKGKMRQPVIKFELEPKISPRQLSSNALQHLESKGLTNVDGNWVLPFEVPDQTIELDEVELVARANKNKFQVTATIEARRITDEDIKRRPSLLQYLRGLGFHIFMNVNEFTITRYTNPVQYKALPFFIDGFLVTSISSLQIPLSRVQYVSYNPTGRDGFISVGLRTYDYRSPDADPLYLKFPINNGFARPSEFQLPVYNSYENTFFQYFGNIDWQPMLELDSSTPITFKIPRLEQDEFKLIIEGMGSEGTLISTVQKVKLDEMEGD